MIISTIDAKNRAAVCAFLTAHWFSTVMAVRGALIDLSQADGLIAREAGEIVGLVTWRDLDGAREILSLDSVRENRGVGTALLHRAEELARAQGRRRMLLITTNDNLRALGFYQRRGYALKALYPNAVAAARQLKPEIPLRSADGIPIRDEIELEKQLECSSVS